MCPDHHSHQFLSNNNKFYHNNVFHLPQVMNSSASSVTSTSSNEYLKNSCLDSGDGAQLSSGTQSQKIPGSIIQTQSLPSSRYKTELCRPFEEFGTCKYGDKCQFAHGSQELRRMVRHPKYKTELCRTFHTHGLCPYGHRCHFIHNDDNLMTEESPNAVTNKTEMRRSVSSSGVSSSSSLSPSPPLSSSPTGSMDNSVFPIANNSFSPRLPIFSSFFAGAVTVSNSNNQFNNSVQQAFAHANA